MKKRNKKVTGLLTVAAAMLAFTVVSCANASSTNPSELQDLLSSTDKTSVDLSTEEFVLNDSSAITVSKAITLTGGSSQYDLKGATLTVKAAGTTIDNVTNIAELIVDESVGDGDFKLSNSNVAKLTVKGGGANSIHIEGVNVASVVVAKEGVRLVLEGSTKVAAVDLQADCVLDSTSDTAVISSLTVASNVKSVTLKGKTKVTTVTAASKEFKMTVTSNDISIGAAVVITSDGKVSAVKVEASGDGVKAPEVKTPEGVTITDDDDADDDSSDDAKGNDEPAPTGIYNVTVTVVNSDGAQSNDDSLEVTVNRDPDSMFHYIVTAPSGYSSYVWTYMGSSTTRNSTYTEPEKYNCYFYDEVPGTYVVNVYIPENGKSATVYFDVTWN